MDSITHIKLLYQVLPWLQQGSPFLARSGQGYSKVPASSMPCRCVKAPVPAGPTLGPPREAQLRAVPGQCQVPNYSSSCSQGPSGQRGKRLLTKRGEVKDKESNREGFKTLRKERIAVRRKLFAAVHRKGEGVGGQRGPAVQQSRGWPGQWGTCQLFAPCSLSLFCSQASLRGGQKCMSPATGTCPTWPNMAVGAQRFVSRILSQGNHTVLPPRNIFSDVSKCP